MKFLRALINQIIALYDKLPLGDDTADRKLLFLKGQKIQPSR